MEKFNNAYAQQWLMLVLLHVITCIRMGKDYKPEEENNTAVIGVYLADSIIGAYHDRFDSDGDSEASSLVGQTMVKQSVASIANAVHKALAVDDANHNLANRIMDSAKDFQHAAKAFQEAKGNPIPPRRPTLGK